MEDNYLRQHGFVLNAVLHKEQIPHQFQLWQQAFPQSDWKSLVILGSVGASVWEKLDAQLLQNKISALATLKSNNFTATDIQLQTFQTTYLQQNPQQNLQQNPQQKPHATLNPLFNPPFNPPFNPIDDYCVDFMYNWQRQSFPQAQICLLYPNRELEAALIPNLLNLTQIARWHHNSPLNLGIHPQYGLWFAVRLVFLIDQEWPVRIESESAHPCESCFDKPCVSKCPVQAVTVEDGFKFQPCAGWRLRENSVCRDNCLSRRACPVGKNYQYSPDQMSYHYLQSLLMVQKWLDK